MSERTDRQTTMFTPPHHLRVVSDHGFNETLQQLRQAIDDADVWLVAEIDPQALMRKGGFDVGSLRQLLWFHPRFMARLLATEPAAAPEIPLKFFVSAGASGVTVTAFNPVLLFTPYPDLTALAKELLEITNRMLSTVSVGAGLQVASRPTG